MMYIQEAITEIQESGLYGNQVHQETLKLALAALQEQAEREKPASYKFLGEGGFQSNSMEEPADVCAVQCMRCGWKFFGDDWWESDYGNEEKSEQIPQYCPHCGRKLGDEIGR